MLTYILISLINGMCISLSRSLNGRLAMVRNAFYASLWNHIVGFIFLSVILVVHGYETTSHHFSAPWYSYLGGAMGALFVAVNSYVLPRTGSTQAAILIISGQMISGVIIDHLSHPSSNLGIQITAVLLIIAGVWFSKLSTAIKLNNKELDNHDESLSGR